jgi:protein-L-isoaspartate(D-aspartate) O-methyltransferase
MSDLAAARRRFADELARLTAPADAGVVEAFATVPRERFLAAGPWLVLGERGYVRTVDGDPRRLYRDIVVAIDPLRDLNNGEPSLHMRLLDELAVRAGDRVLHVGCGTGYYTAILAELAGPAGRVVAIEYLPELAERARRNLAPYAAVAVVCGDGATHDAGPVDAIYVNAGVTGPSPLWLERLAMGGRLLLPLTTRDWWGRVLKIVRRPVGFDARILGRCGFMPCVTGRDDAIGEALADALLAGGAEAVRSLRTDLHGRDENCWLHVAGLCLSRRPLGR